MLPNIKNIKRGVKKMDTIKQSEIVVLNNGCYFDPFSVCEKGLKTPDHKLCAKCVADSFGDVVRRQL